MTTRRLLAGAVLAALAPLTAGAADLASCKGQVPSINVIGQGMPAVSTSSTARAGARC